MSVPVARTPRTSGGPVHATRQQLDELDALLQRMLSLPVNPADESAPEASPASIVPSHNSLSSRNEEYVEPPPSRTRPVSQPALDPRPAQTPWKQPLTPQPVVAPPSQGQRSYPPSYMIVETASPQFFDPTGEEARYKQASLEPKMLAGNERPVSSAPLPESHLDRAFQPPIDPVRQDMEPPIDQDQEGGEWIPLRSSWQPSAQTWKPLAETWEQTRGSGPEHPAFPESPVIPPPPRAVPEMPSWRESVIPPAPSSYDDMRRAGTPPPIPAAPHAGEGVAGALAPLPVLGPPPEPAEPATPMFLAPLVWFNKLFDLFLFPMGPLGSLFRGAGGRTVLGTLGLLCLAAAIVLAVVERFGWTR